MKNTMMNMDIDPDDLMVLTDQTCKLYKWFAQQWLNHDDATLLTEATLSNFYFWLPDDRRCEDAIWTIAQLHLNLHLDGMTEFPERYYLVDERMP